MSSILPTQLGYNAPGSQNRSQIIMGKDTTLAFEAVGLGPKGRPDILETVTINISQGSVTTDSDNVSTTNYVKICSISIDVVDLIAIAANNPNLPKNATDNTKIDLSLFLKEVSVCETDNNGNSSEKRMVILASETYDPPPSSS